MTHQEHSKGGALPLRDSLELFPLRPSHARSFYVALEDHELVESTFPQQALLSSTAEICNVNSSKVPNSGASAHSTPLADTDTPPDTVDLLSLTYPGETASPAQRPSRCMDPRRSAFIHSLEYTIPMVGTMVISTTLLALVICTSVSPLVAPDFLQNLAVSRPKTVTISATIISTVLSSALGFCYSSSLYSVLRKRMVLRAQSLRTLSAWIDLKQHSLTLSRGFIQFLLTTTSLILLGALTTAINTLITPVPVQVALGTSWADWDFRSDPFREWFVSNFSSSESTCKWWMPVGPCISTMLLPALVDAGQAAGSAPHTKAYPSLTLMWLYNLVWNGTTGGTLPLVPERVFAGLGGSVQPSWSSFVDYEYAVYLQSLSADITCQSSTTSPLSVNTSLSPVPNQVISTCSCGEAGPVTMLIGQDWIQTCLCPDDSLSGQWNFFLRNHGQYITTTELENLTCSINPYLGNATSSYESQTLQYTTVIGPDYRSSPDVSIIGALLLLLPQIVHLSQNQQGNAVADNVLDALLSQGFTLGNTLGNTSQNLDFYLMGAYESIWQNFLLGWIEYTITCLRREYSPAVNPLNDPASWRITGQLTGKPYGWDFVPLNILFLTPILLVSAVTVSLLLWALHGRRTTDLVGTHDLTDAVTLLLAGATCHENLRNRIEEAGKERGDVLEDRTVREIRVIFRAGRLARDAE